MPYTAKFKLRVLSQLSWSWPGAFDTVRSIFAVNLRRYLAGEPLENVIDPARGY